MIDFNYFLFNVGKYDTDELSKINSLISAVFMLDKKDEKRLMQNSIKAMEIVTGLPVDERNEFVSWVRDVLLKKVEVEQRGLVNEVLDKLEKRKEVSEVTYAIERMIDDIRERGIEQGIERGIEQGIERGIEQGIERGTFELIKRMLRKGRTPESIAYDTDIPIERIMEISEQL